MAKSCRAASRPSEIEVLPSADIWSIPALISAALYDHGTRVVASDAKDTTEKRTASTPRKYWFTSCLAKAFSPLGPSIEPSGKGFFIEPLSSSTRAKSIGVAQGGLGGGGGGGGVEGGGGGGVEGGEGGGPGDGDGGPDGDGGGASGGGGKGGDSSQAAASSRPRELASWAIVCARSALDESVAICSSVAEFKLFPKPHANTVTPSPLTSAAASTAVSNSVLPGAASTVCPPSDNPNYTPL